MNFSTASHSKGIILSADRLHACLVLSDLAGERIGQNINVWNSFCEIPRISSRIFKNNEHKASEFFYICRYNYIALLKKNYALMTKSRLTATETIWDQEY